MINKIKTVKAGHRDNHLNPNQATPGGIGRIGRIGSDAKIGQRVATASLQRGNSLQWGRGQTFEWHGE